MDDDFAALQQSLVALTGEARTKAERKALRKVGKLVKDAIAENAPERPDLPSGTALPVGALKESIRARVHIATDPIDDSSTVTIGPNKDTAHVADWVENGHAHVAGGYSKIVNQATGARRGPGRVVSHTPAYPFIRPAADAVEDEAIELFADVMTEEIDKVMSGSQTD